MNKPFFLSDRHAPLFTGRLQNCFDSHVHWRATGQFSMLLDLKNLRMPEDLSHLKINRENYRGEWLMGFGWDQNYFCDQKFPNRKILDQIFSDAPVYFRRIDGHVVWVSTEALKRAQLFTKNIESPQGGIIELDNEGWPTGILVDAALAEIEKVIPLSELTEVQNELLIAQNIFHKAGFSHIRDLTCDALQWRAACQIEKSGELKLAVEQFFSAENPDHFSACVDLALTAREESHTLLRPKGVKIYYDGALGSEGAWLSRPYKSGSGSGLPLYSDTTLEEMIRTCFEKNIEIAIHTIGDEAAHRVASVATKLLKVNVKGSLHLEHAELLRPETIALLAKLKVICHMQPSHWLSDKIWLRDKIGELTDCAFRWADLQNNNIKFDFGSDSPIETTSLQKTIEALCDAEKNGIPIFSGDKLIHHQHTDLLWCPNTYTEFKEGQPQHLYFSGKKIF